jgi:hypothetical protein
MPGAIEPIFAPMYLVLEGDHIQVFMRIFPLRGRQRALGQLSSSLDF